MGCKRVGSKSLRKVCKTKVCRGKKIEKKIKQDETRTDEGGKTREWWKGRRDWKRREESTWRVERGR